MKHLPKRGKPREGSLTAVAVHCRYRLVWCMHSWPAAKTCVAVPPQLAGLGVAVGNAGPLTKAAADVVLDVSNDEDAVARAIERYVLQPRGVQV